MKKAVITALLALVPLASAKADFTPYLGVYGGHGQVSGSGQDKDGLLLGGKVIGSFKTSSWFLDGALGYQAEKLTGSSADVSTASGLLELDSRYMISNNFSIGPVVQMQFGTQTQRSQTSETQDALLMGGAKLMYQNWLNHTHPYRIELSVQKNVTDIGFDYLTAVVGFQIGFPWIQEVKPVPAPTPAPTPVVVAKTEFAEKQLIAFKFNSSNIEEKTKEKLRKLGRFLETQPGVYAAIKISGHADIRGEEMFNMILSEKRAVAVKNVLVANGVPDARVTVKAYGYSKPLDSDKTEEAFAKNRRTEIEFFGVKPENVESFNKAVREIMQGDGTEDFAPSEELPPNPV